MTQLPLILTTARIFATFPVAYLLTLHSEVMNWIALVIFVLASITDYYDGYFARKYNAVTNLGKFLDPVADKILVSCILILLLHLNKVDPWMVILFITRDTLVGGIRAAAAADRIIIPAQTTGKWKAALQMIAIPLLMVNDLHPYLPTQKLGYGLLWFSVLLSIASGWDYIRLYISGLKSQKSKS